MINRKRRPAKPPRQPSKAATIIAGTIPERGLKIGEAARLIGVESYVLRFWETQFPCLKPRHARSKHRFYQAADLETLKLIKRLLHGEGFTISGANKYIRENGIDASKIARRLGAREKPGSPIDGQARRALAEVRRDLESIRKMLQNR